MHEVGLMQQALELALDSARNQGASRIHCLTMRIGPLAGVVPDALRFAFDIVTQGTQAEGAMLEVREVPILCWCAGCSLEFSPPDFVCVCPVCGLLTSDVRQGKELDVVSLEVS